MHTSITKPSISQRLLSELRTIGAVMILAIYLTGVEIIYSSVLAENAWAQNLNQMQADLPGQSFGVGTGQGSLLPPEVVPAPLPAGKEMIMGATPGQISGSGLNAANASMNMNPIPPMSPQELRRAAIGQLLGNTELVNSNNQFSVPGQAALDQSGQGIDPNHPAFAQPDWLAGNSPMSRSQSAYGSVSQVQTLTAGSKLPIVRHDTRRGGAANNISGAGAMGFGLLRPGQVRRPGSLLGLGIFGIAATGFGTRNGFRF